MIFPRGSKPLALVWEEISLLSFFSELGGITVDDSGISVENAGKLSASQSRELINAITGAPSTVVGRVLNNKLEVGASGELFFSPTITTQKLVYKQVPLLSGSSGTMCVNGSSTPVSFSWSPSSGEKWVVDRAGIILSDGGGLSLNVFGSLPAGLSNGLLVEVKSNGSNYTIATAKNNFDIYSIFCEGLRVEQSGGLLGESYMIAGFQSFDDGIVLDGSLGDFIKFSVNDNLSSIDALRSWVRVKRAA